MTGVSPPGGYPHGNQPTEEEAVMKNEKTETEPAQFSSRGRVLFERRRSQLYPEHRSRKSLSLSGVEGKPAVVFLDTSTKFALGQLPWPLYQQIRGHDRAIRRRQLGSDRGRR